MGLDGISQHFNNSLASRPVTTSSICGVQRGLASRIANERIRAARQQQPARLYVATHLVESSIAIFGPLDVKVSDIFQKLILNILDGVSCLTKIMI
jgi:hypothetical protein